MRSTIFRSFAFPAASIAGAVAVVLGVWRHRPKRPLGFVLLTLAQLSLAGGDLVYLHLELTAGDEGWAEDWHDPVANAFFIARVPLLAMALVVFIRRRTPGWHMPTLLDTCVLATAASLVW